MYYGTFYIYISNAAHHSYSSFVKIPLTFFSETLTIRNSWPARSKMASSKDMHPLTSPFFLISFSGINFVPSPSDHRKLLISLNKVAIVSGGNTGLGFESARNSCRIICLTWLSLLDHLRKGRLQLPNSEDSILERLSKHGYWTWAPTTLSNPSLGRQRMS